MSKEQVKTTAAVSPAEDVPAGDSPPKPVWRFYLAGGAWLVWLLFLLVMMVVRLREAARI
jgi:hypothetical protein